MIRESLKQQIRSAKAHGGALINGELNYKRNGQPPSYILMVRDFNGRLYLRRDLPEQTYMEAVSYWIALRREEAAA
jgi:hypothetical protein